MSISEKLDNITKEIGGKLDDTGSIEQQLQEIYEIIKSGAWPSGGGGSYELPTASASTKGGIKIGSGIEMNGDVAHVVQSRGVGFIDFTNPIASGDATDPSSWGQAFYTLDPGTDIWVVVNGIKISNVDETAFVSIACRGVALAGKVWAPGENINGYTQNHEAISVPIFYGDATATQIRTNNLSGCTYHIYPMKYAS